MFTLYNVRYLDDWLFSNQLEIFLTPKSKEHIHCLFNSCQLLLNHFAEEGRADCFTVVVLQLSAFCVTS